MELLRQIIACIPLKSNTRLKICANCCPLWLSLFNLWPSLVGVVWCCCTYNHTQQWCHWVLEYTTTSLQQGDKTRFSGDVKMLFNFKESWFHIPVEHSQKIYDLTHPIYFNNVHILLSTYTIMVLYVSRQWLKSEDIQRISLFFHNKSLEKEVRGSTSKLASFTPSGCIGVVVSKRIIEHIVTAFSFAYTYAYSEIL